MLATSLLSFGTVVLDINNSYYFCENQLISNSHYVLLSMVYGVLKKKRPMKNNGKIEILSVPIYLQLDDGSYIHYNMNVHFLLLSLFLFYFLYDWKKQNILFYFSLSAFNKCAQCENQQFTPNYHIDRCLHFFQYIYIILYFHRINNRKYCTVSWCIHYQ